MTFAPNEDSDQCMKKHWVLSYPLSVLGRLIRLGDAQADPSLCWAHRPFCLFCHAVALLEHYSHLAKSLFSLFLRYTGSHTFIQADSSELEMPGLPRMTFALSYVYSV